MARFQCAFLFISLLADTIAKSSKNPVKLSKLSGSNGIIVSNFDSVSDSTNDDWWSYYNYQRTSVGGDFDFNGDGVADIIIGAPYADSRIGQIAVIYGGSSSTLSQGNFDVSSLDGSNGFLISGLSSSLYSGYTVSGAGDMNNDGYDDVIISVQYYNSLSGISYVLYGGASVGNSGSFDLDDFTTGPDGITITGDDTYDYSGDSLGGGFDFNNDGYDDIIIGAWGADGTYEYSTGSAYIVFGGESMTDVDLGSLNGVNGFVMSGEDEYDYTGESVSGAGDINGDGYDDIIIGTYGGAKSYVVFGGSSVGSSGSLTLSSLSGSDGFVIISASGTNFGYSVSGAGNMNGDDYADIIISAPYATTSVAYEGKSFVVFGSSTIGSSGTIDTTDLDGSNGFTIKGDDYASYSGWAVSNAGDVNGDGYADVIIGVPYASPNTDDTSAGLTYIVFGGNRVGWSGNIKLSQIDGKIGVKIKGRDAYDNTGGHVACAGDFNDDGKDDVIIGTFGVAEAYVIIVEEGSNSSSSSTLAIVITLIIVFGCIAGCIAMCVMLCCQCNSRPVAPYNDSQTQQTIQMTTVPHQAQVIVMPQQANAQIVGEAQQVQVVGAPQAQVVGEAQQVQVVGQPQVVMATAVTVT